MRRTVVIDVVALSRSLLGPATPRLNELAGGLATIGPVFPAVTCPVQATYLTGRRPADHGIVGNGWYFRDLAEVMFWKQSNRLVQGEKIWHLGRRRNPSFTCASCCWWFSMATDADLAVTPRPIYCADGSKLPDCYTVPAGLRSELTRAYGSFPLHRFWGPATSIRASHWIASSARYLEERHQPTLQLVYLPHLDYVLQREGPDGTGVARDLAELDRLCGELIEFFSSRGCRVIVLSEYAITGVRRPVHPNRLLRAAGLLAVKTDLGREYLDPGRCRALAVADHQAAHLYVADPADLPAVRELFAYTPGVAMVLERPAQQAFGLDHPRAGELVLMADPESWFTYYFWEDDQQAPDYARTVNIHAKPGYDPCELFLDPGLRWPRARAAWILLRKRLGFRTLLEVVPLAAELVRGSHGRPVTDPELMPVLLTSEPGLLDADHYEAIAVCDLILDHVFRD